MPFESEPQCVTAEQAEGRSKLADMVGDPILIGDM